MPILAILFMIFNLQSLIDNIFVTFDGRVFNRQSAYLWIQTAFLFLPTCSFIWTMQAIYRGFSRKRKANPIFNFTFRYIDDVLSLHNSRLSDFVDPIYPIEHEIKDTTDIANSASYLDLHLEIDSENWLRTKLYHRRNAFNFPLWTFHWYVATLQHHLHMEYISLSYSDLMIPTMTSLILNWTPVIITSW